MMGAKTSIEWTRGDDGQPGASWNPIRARNRETGKVGWYCEHATPGCEHCYSEAMNHRLGTGIDFKAQNRDKVEIFLDEEMLSQPLRWRGPRKIFVCSMTDWMADFVEDTWISEILRVVDACPQHIFQTLTKRADRQRRYFNGLAIPFENLWLGVSCEDQPRADERIPLLLATPAAVRWISAEPMLGPVDLNGWVFPVVEGGGRINWVIVGGESGPRARPMHPDWARSIRDLCVAAGVPFFFKQWGAWLPGQNDSHPHWTNPGIPEKPQQIAHWQDGSWGPQKTRNPEQNYVMWDPDGTPHPGGSRTYDNDFEVRAWASRVGKKRAGRLLDGREWSEHPAQERA